MVQTRNYSWGQGEDEEINLIYSTKASEQADPVPVNLTGWTARMDIAKDADRVRLVTLNSSDDAGTTPIDNIGSSDNEIILGSDGTIYVPISRSLTLPGGPLATAITAGFLVFKYDLFLRSPAGKQKKHVEGTITFDPSTTLWA